MNTVEWIAVDGMAGWRPDTPRHDRSIFEMPGHPDEGDRFMLEYGLERILDGIEVLVNRRRDAA